MDKETKDALEIINFLADMGRKFEDEEYCAKMDKELDDFYIERLGTPTPLFFLYNTADNNAIYKEFHIRPRKTILIDNDKTGIYIYYKKWSHLNEDGRIVTPSDEIKQLFPKCDKALLWDKLDEDGQLLYAINAPLDSYYIGKINDYFVFTVERSEMEEQKSTYLELKVPLRWSAEWFENLRNAMAEEKIPVKWQGGSYHITAVFANNISEREKVQELLDAFERILSKQAPLSLTLDKVDAFVTQSNEEIIVNITSKSPSKEFVALMDKLRTEAKNVMGDIESEFRLHITLGRIDSSKASIEQVRRITDSITVPSFDLSLKEAEFRFYRGDTIRKWGLNSINNMNDYRKINREVMTDTKRMYESLPELQAAVRFSIRHQFMVAQEEVIDLPAAKECVTQYVTSARRTFEAAKVYRGKKVAVLNFANNHSVGGAPFSAGAQEESLCRCSTLYPCLQAMYGQFYKKHQDEYGRRQIDETGSDDLIYTPDVVVFKTDERTDPEIPQMMEQGEWYKVDVITCAAPELRHRTHKPRGYEEMIRRRIKKILDVAAKEKAEVLILGAWGCGAFGNDIAVVSNAFYSLLENYGFETVEFAVGATKFFDYFQKGTVVG